MTHRFFCILFFLCAIGANGQPTHLLHKLYRNRFEHIDTLYDVIAKYPRNERLAKWHALADWAKENGESELAGMAMLSANKEAAGQPNANLKEIEADLNQIMNEYGLDSKYLTADILQFKGDLYLQHHNKNSIAFEYYIEAYNVYRNFAPVDFPGKQLYIYELSMSYYRYGDYENTIRYLQKCLTLKSLPRHDLSISMQNTIGLCYVKMHKYDSALLYFKLALDNAHGSNKTRIWQGIIHGNIAGVYVRQGRYEDALPLLEENVQTSIANRERKNAIQSACQLSTVYLQLNKNEDAAKVMARAKSIFDSSGFEDYHRIALNLYNALAKMNAAKGDMRSAYTYSDLALIERDSVAAFEIRTNLTDAREKAGYLQLRFEQEKLRSEKQRQLLVRNSLLMLIILLSTIGVLVLSRQRINRKRMEAQLDAAASRLIAYNKTVSEKDQLISHISGQMEQMKKEEQEVEDLEIRSQLERAVLLTDEQWDEFRKLYEKVHKGFFNKLKKKMPDLSPAETRFMALSKLKLSVRDMSAMLGVSPGTIRIYRFRIRKKLKLEKDEMIEELLDDF